jgi:uncharacterized protein (TIGR03437 family)
MNARTLFLALSAVCLSAVSAFAASQTPVALGSNSTFVILAGTTVTVTGGGTITGDIGINSTANVSGVSANNVNGSVYQGGSVAAQAQADLAAAFNDAAGRQNPVIVSGEIGALTLTPGLYRSLSSLAISAGDLTLDAQGNSSAVFIFQVASTLTVTAGRHVILAGGANAANIFWQVGSSATLGAKSVLHGSILAAASISAQAGAVLDGRALAGSGAVTVDTAGGNTFTAPVAPVLPTVTATAPARSAMGFPVGNRLAVTFGTAMDPSTITPSTFFLMRGATAVGGTVSYSGTTGTFTPFAALAPLTTYTATITTGAKDPSGNALGVNYAWSFNTSSARVIIQPSVISTSPGNLETGVAVGNKLAYVFSEAMNPATINTSTFTLTQGGVAVAGSVAYTGVTATFTPAVSLAPLTAFTATVTTGVADLGGNPLGSQVELFFTTGTTPDINSPTVISTSPANQTTSVAANTAISAAFSKAMDPATITNGTFTLQRSAWPVLGTVITYGTSAVFTPAAPLILSATYTATITTGAKDLAGNAFNVPFTWTFVASSVAPTAPAISPAGSVSSLGTVNDASYTTPVAAGSIAAVFGTNLSIGQASALTSGPLPLSLSQSSILIGGQVAPLYFASAGQVNVQIPWELAGQSQVSIAITSGGMISQAQTVNIAPFSPGIFSADASGSGQGAVLVAASAQLAAPATPAARGSYVAIYCTGLGAVTNQPPDGYPAQSVPLSVTLTNPVVTIGGVPAVVSFSGLAPTLVGLYQVNAVVPVGVAPGNSVPVVISMGAVPSNTVTIAVQ